MNYKCRACNGSVTPNFQTPGFSWGKCQDCGCVQKLISEEEYHSLSPTYDPGTYAESIDSVSDLRNVLDVDQKVSLLKSLLGTEKKSGTFLDIGCGMGGYLIAAQELGFTPKGIEPSKEYCLPAKKLTDFEIYTSYYKPGLFKEKFAVVMLSHVIEHIYSPSQFLKEVMDDVEIGGKVIMLTPNPASLSSTVTGKYWSMYKPIDHVTMMTKESLRKVCPENADLVKLYTSEWPGEFAAHCLSATRTYAKTKTDESQLLKEQFKKKNVRQSTLSLPIKSLLAVLSFPALIAGRFLDAQSCCYAVFERKC